MPILLALLQIASQPATQADPNGVYWQQRISYDISASLDEPSGVLGGTQHVRYYNHSPDTLTTFSFHLYLNAFRPGSRWADEDSIEHNRRFNDLKDPDFGFNHVRNVRIMGQPVEPVYPFAPDSTIVRFRLPHPLLPGDSLDADLEWDARPSTVPRRQGRQGRAFDFAQWYPRVVAYDTYGWEEHPLYPAGEFYGDFGEFTVRLDVPEDQVVGATGVAVCGDPGWESANRTAEPVDYQRRWYPAFADALPDSACAPKAPGRKTIVWRAEDVHHFAMSMRPDYRYEGWHWGPVAIHVLYQPGDEDTWGRGIAVRRTAVALEWLDGLFGKFPWPQITNVHRIEGGGTEFPMMIHDGSASQGLILHELGHNYLMGVLASNEWKEGFLDEGFTSFQTTWFVEAHGVRGSYQNTEREILSFDLDGLSQPTSLVSEDYRDFLTYNVMIYTRGELFYHQLREIVGEEAMRKILRTYYDRWKLKHVNETRFKEVAEEVSGKDLTTFFAQWLHSTELYDYAVGRVKVRREGRGEDGGWVTRVEVKRKAPGMFPVDVVVRSKEDSAVARADGLAETEWVTVRTRGKPKAVVIDPRVRAHDWNMLNNTKRKNWLGIWDTGPGADWYLDPVFSTRTHRDRVARGVLPTVWYNGEGGVMVGARVRSNYLGRFNQEVAEYSLATRHCCKSGERFDNWYVRLANPTWLRAPRTTVGVDAFHLEGREGASLFVDHQTRGHLAFGPTTSLGASLRWVATYDTSYVIQAQYADAGTIEGEAHVSSSEQRGPWLVSGHLSLGGGVEYRNQGAGVDTRDRYDAQPYFRGYLEATAKRNLDARSTLGLRVFGGWVSAKRDPAPQRWFSAAGADPYEQLRNPFIRSRDALFTNDLHFHAPGGGDVRGLDPSLLVTAIAAANAEVDRSILQRPGAKIARDVRVALFGDVAMTDGFFTLSGQNNWVGDAGVGLRLAHRIGQTSFVTSVDFPVFVSHPDRAVGGNGGRFRFRWTFGVE